MTQSTAPNLFIARITGPLEMFSYVAFIFGILFKLQSWPYATELFIVGFLGLFVSYLILLPLRLKGLKAILPKADYRFALVTSICIGTLIGCSSLILLLTVLGAAFPVAINTLDVIRVIAGLGVAAAFVYDFVRTPPAPNTAQHAIAIWLRRRLNIIMVFFVIGIFFRFLF